MLVTSHHLLVDLSSIKPLSMTSEIYSYVKDNSHSLELSAGSMKENEVKRQVRNNTMWIRQS